MLYFVAFVVVRSLQLESPSRRQWRPGAVFPVDRLPDSQAWCRVRAGARRALGDTCGGPESELCR